ncbi:MAG: glycosyltransferase family 2 protein [Verrucomicrobia bacterium]|jgi:glycosyltransferase involved in cell wall biosynthesis|nr:glycosyltransferase family 2 protein [Verrucomicrobiota bacterium]
MPKNISICITAGNEEANIRRCLESATWAGEIVVVDSYSKDRTVEICREYTDRVYQHEWLGYIGQKNLIKDLAKGPWILFLDADEEISTGLRDEIIGEFSSGNTDAFAGYEFPRLVYYLGRWITHGDWYPDTKLRLFRKDKGECGGKEPHDRTTVHGRVKRLSNPLYHYTYTGISNQMATLNRFTSISAEGKDSEGRRFRYIDLIFRPCFRFIRCYFLKRGFLDGLPGLVVAHFSAVGVFAKYAKLWEIQRCTPLPAVESPKADD